MFFHPPYLRGVKTGIAGPFPDALAAISVSDGALAVELLVLELASVRATIGARVGALAVELVVLELAGVRFAIGIRVGAVAVLLAFAVCFAGVWHAVTTFLSWAS